MPRPKVVPADAYPLIEEVIRRRAEAKKIPSDKQLAREIRAKSGVDCSVRAIQFVMKTLKVRFNAVSSSLQAVRVALVTPSGTDDGETLDCGRD